MRPRARSSALTISPDLSFPPFLAPSPPSFPRLSAPLPAAPPPPPRLGPALRGVGAALPPAALLRPGGGRRQRGELHALVDQLAVCPRVSDHAVVHHVDHVRAVRKLRLVRDQHARFPGHGAADASFKEVVPNVSIHCAQGVVEEVNVGVRVQRPRERHSVPLPAGQVDPLLPNLRHVAGWEHVQVRAQGACLKRELVALLVIRRVGQHVVPQRSVPDPRLLGGERERTRGRYLPVRAGHLS